MKLNPEQLKELHNLYKEKDFWWSESRKAFDKVLMSILHREGEELEQHNQQYENAKRRYTTAASRLLKLRNGGSQNTTA